MITIPTLQDPEAEDLPQDPVNLEGDDEPSAEWDQRLRALEQDCSIIKLKICLQSQLPSPHSSAHSP